MKPLEIEFVGYDNLESEQLVSKYRKVSAKGKEQYQMVLAKTPFYAESGGQVGDTGTLISADEIIPVTDTRKENDLIIHFTPALPADLSVQLKQRLMRKNGSIPCTTIRSPT